MDTETGVESETDYENLKDLDLKITHNDTLLPRPHLARDPVPEDIASMIEFNMI